MNPMLTPFSAVVNAHICNLSTLSNGKGKPQELHAILPLCLKILSKNPVFKYVILLKHVCVCVSVFLCVIPSDEGIA